MTTVRVLLIEDYPDQCEFVRFSLLEYGDRYAVTCTTSLREALALLATSNFDAALLDLELDDVSLASGMAGDSLRQIREVAPSLPVVVLSNGVDEGLAARMMAAGAAAVARKDHLITGVAYSREIDNAVLSTCPVQEPENAAAGPACPLPGRREADPDRRDFFPRPLEFRSFGHGMTLLGAS